MSILKKSKRSPMQFRQPFGASKAISPAKHTPESPPPDQPKKKPKRKREQALTPSDPPAQQRGDRRAKKRAEQLAAVRSKPASTTRSKNPKKSRPNRKVATPRSLRVTLPVSAEEKALIVASAEKRGQPVSLMLRKLIFDGDRKGLGRPHPEVVPTRKQAADKRLPEKARQRRTKRKK